MAAWMEIIGAFDIATEQQRMNGLKNVPVSIANILLQEGQNAITQAQTTANAENLPGPTARANCAAHLQWHADALGKLVTTPNTIYPSWADLEKWVMQSFIEMNAVDEGSAYTYWMRMWNRIGAAIAALPAEVRAGVSNAIEYVTGVPTWAWGVGIAGIIGLLGFAAYRILTGPAGGAIVGAYTGRRK